MKDTLLPVLIVFMIVLAGLAAIKHMTDVVILNIGIAIINTIFYVHSDRK